MPDDVIWTKGEREKLEEMLFRQKTMELLGKIVDLLEDIRIEVKHYPVEER